MIVVDTSIWIEHLNRGLPRLAELLDRRNVLSHPLVIGELAMGYLPDREPVLSGLQSLPGAPVASLAELLMLVEGAALSSTGIQCVDAHLLASTMLVPGGVLWTTDARLHEHAERLGCAFRP